MSDPAEIIAKALRDAQVPQNAPTRLATVTGGTATTISVQFDGEASASSRAYAKTITPVYIGERVVMLRTGSTWTAIGRIPTSSTLPQRQASRGILFAAQAVNPSTWTRVQNWSEQDGIGVVPYVGAGQWQVNYAGWYRVDFGWAFTNGGWGAVRFGSVAISGTRKVAQGYSMQGIESHTAGGFLSWEARLSVGQTVEFHVYQDSGATLNLSAAVGDDRTWYTIRRVDD